MEGQNNKTEASQPLFSVVIQYVDIKISFIIAQTTFEPGFDPSLLPVSLQHEPLTARFAADAYFDTWMQASSILPERYSTNSDIRHY